MKGLLFAFVEIFLVRHAGSPEWARYNCSYILPTQVANHSMQFGSSCLLTELAI